MKKLFTLLLVIGVCLTVYFARKGVETENTLHPEKVSTKKSTVSDIEKRARPSGDIEEDSFNISSNALINKITDKKITFIERTRDILQLRKMKLSKTDEKDLLAHLEKVDFEESTAIKNDIIEHLVRYGSDKKMVGDGLLRILNNSNQDQVLREYVLQYVPEFYQSRWQPGLDWDSAEEADRQVFNETIWNMIELTEGSMAGGALFALFRMAPKYSDINQENVFEKSHSIINDFSYMNPNRMAAIQILSYSANEEYFNSVKEIFFDEEQPTLVRVTAMNTASKSKLSDPLFLQKLNELASADKIVHPSLKKCAILTLNKMNR